MKDPLVSPLHQFCPMAHQQISQIWVINWDVLTHRSDPGVVQQIFRSCCELPAQRIQLVEGLQGSIQKLTKDGPSIGIQEFTGEGACICCSDHHFKAETFDLQGLKRHSPLWPCQIEQWPRLKIIDLNSWMNYHDLIAASLE